MAVSLKAVLGEAARSLESVREGLGVPAPYTVRGLLDTYLQPKTLEWNQIENDPLTGHFSITLHPNGAWNFTGRIYNGGKDVYDFTLEVTVTIPGSGGDPEVVLGFAQRGHLAGSIFGWGSRSKTWTLSGPESVTFNWLNVRHAKLDAKLHRENHTWNTALGGALLFGKVILANAVAGPVGSLVVLAAEAEDLVGPGFAGIPGASLVSKGVVLLRGVAGYVPAYLAEQFIDWVWDARPLYDHERVFAETVFGKTIPWDRIRLTPCVGIGGREFVVPLFDNTILMNIGPSFNSPDTSRDEGATFKDGTPILKKAGQVFIHELVHAWQIAHSVFPTGWMCKGLMTQATTLTGDMSVYGYGPPVGPWRSFDLEKQASIVEGWFAGNETNLGVHDRQRKYQPMDTGNPYYHYIEKHIRAGSPD